MINREIKTVTINYYTGTDSYGQQLATLTSSKQIDATFGLINQSNTTNAKYLEATHYLLTKDDSITDKCKVVVDNHEYKVKYVSPHTRWNEVFLQW